MRELAGALELVSPLAVLARGYSIVQDESGRVLRDGAGLSAESVLRIRLQSAELDARLVKVRALDSPDGPADATSWPASEADGVGLSRSADPVAGKRKGR